MLEAHGRVDVLVNNAGVRIDGAVADVGLEDLDRAFQVNALSPFALAGALAGPMAERGEGVIANVVAPKVSGGRKGMGAYAASKAALESVTQTLRQEVGGRGVAVFAFDPGWVKTGARPGRPRGAGRGGLAAGRPHRGGEVQPRAAQLSASSSAVHSPPVARSRSRRPWRCANAGATSSASWRSSPETINRSGGRVRRAATSSSSGPTRFAVTVGAHGPGSPAQVDARELGRGDAVGRRGGADGLERRGARGRRR